MRVRGACGEADACRTHRRHEFKLEREVHLRRPGGHPLNGATQNLWPRRTPRIACRLSRLTPSFFSLFSLQREHLNERKLREDFLSPQRSPLDDDRQESERRVEADRAQLRSRKHALPRLRRGRRVLREGGESSGGEEQPPLPVGEKPNTRSAAVVAFKAEGREAEGHVGRPTRTADQCRSCLLYTSPSPRD